MAHIRKHPVDPTKWQVRYRDPSGRELSKTFTRKSHADQFRIKVEAEALEGRFVDPRAARRTFIEFAKASEPARLNRQATTRARDESVMRSLVLPTFAETPVGRIRTSQVRSWLTSLERAGYSPNTIRKAFQLLARVLEVAVEDRAVPTNPAAAIRDAKLLPTADPDHRFLTTDEIGRLAEAIDPAYRGMVSLAAASGARFGELAALERTHLNLGNRKLRIEQTLKRTNPPEIGRPKTEASRRTVRLPAWVVSVMVNHLALHAGESLVFPSPGGTLINPSNWRRRIWQPAVAAAGLEGVTFHALRHSSASLLVAEGVNAKVIQTRLGHSDVRTTLQVYGHLYEGWDDAAADALDVAFGSAADNSRTSNVLPFAPQ